MNIKRYLFAPAAVMFSVSAFADTVTPITSAQWNTWSVPTGIRTSGFWDGPSDDGTACGIGFWLTGTNSSSCLYTGGFGFVGSQPGAIPFLSVKGSPTSPVRFTINPTNALRAITLRLKVSGFRESNVFGYYLINTPNILTPLFIGTQKAGTTASMIPTGPFAFYLKNGNNQTFTSEANYNFALFSRTPANLPTVDTNLTDYYIGVEDRPVVAGPYNPGYVQGTDADYNDIIAQIVVPNSDPPSGCVLTQGGYKNRFKNLVVKAAGVGMGTSGETYTPVQIDQILNTPVAGNGLISLAHQLITAKLNIYYSASATQNVLDAISAADTLIGSRVVPPVGPGYLNPSQTSALIGVLDSYNNGLLGTPHCK